MDVVKTITEEQLKTIQEGQTELSEILVNIGSLESQKHGLLHGLAKVNEKIETFKRGLEDEYGAITINLKDGSYTVIEQKE